MMMLSGDDSVHLNEQSYFQPSDEQPTLYSMPDHSNPELMMIDPSQMPTYSYGHIQNYRGTGDQGNRGTATKQVYDLKMHDAMFDTQTLSSAHRNQMDKAATLPL